MNSQSIAQALAARFAPGTMSVPSGLADVVDSTEVLPQAIGATPTVLVFPPEETFSYSPGTRRSMQLWRVVFYMAQPGDIGATVTDLYLWRDVLVERLIGNVQLGQSGSGGVAHAELAGARTGRVTYNEAVYVGIELAINVALSEGINPVA